MERTLNQWIEGINAALPGARDSGHLARFTEDLANAMLAVDPAGLRNQGYDGPRRAGFYRDLILSLAYPVKSQAA